MAKVARAARNAASTNFTITLPAGKAGAYLTFILVAASHSASEVMLDAGTGSTIKGISMGVTDVAQAAISDQKLKFPDSAAVGSRVSLVCDGTDWYILDAVASVAFTTGAF